MLSWKLQAVSYRRFLHNILVGTVFLAEYRKAIVLTAAHYRFRRAIYR